MYFNARKYWKDMVKIDKVENIIVAMKLWAIEEHGWKSNDVFKSNYAKNTFDWNSKTKPTPLTEKEIRKFRGEE